MTASPIAPPARRGRSRTPAALWVLLVPFLIAVQTVLNLGIALLFSTATAYFKDVSNLLNYVLRFVLFATPVVYPVAILPAGAKAILQWNPLYPLFASYQSIIAGQMPAGGLLVQSVIWALVLVTAGGWVFLRHERSFGLHV